MTEANDETRDEVTLDLGGSFFDENLHSAKHGHSRRKTFTHFDSMLSFQSADMSPDDNKSMSKE